MPKARRLEVSQAGRALTLLTVRGHQLVQATISVWKQGPGRRCPAAWLEALAGRWGSPFHLWPLWPTVQSGIPCHVGYQPSWATLISPSTGTTPLWSMAMSLCFLKWLGRPQGQEGVQVFCLARKEIFHIKHFVVVVRGYLQGEGETD